MNPQAKICNSCSNSGMWYPASVSKLEALLLKLLKPHKDIKSIKALSKNIAYNLQYIEFQIKLQEEFETSEVLMTQNWKITIITGISIIESLIYYLLISNNLHKKTNWQKDPFIKIENEKKIGDHSCKIMNLIFMKDEERLEKITLNKMINIAQKNSLLGESSSQIYKKLRHLSSLRNRVHLHISTNDTDTDYMQIQKSDLDMLKQVIYAFMMSSLFSLTSEQKKLFNYLK